MDSRKQAIIDALRRWIARRPGLEFRDYGDVRAYRAELRSITRDKQDAERLLDAVESIDAITADDLIAASIGAFSGRLTIYYTEPGSTFAQQREREPMSANNQCAHCGRMRKAHKDNEKQLQSLCPSEGAAIDYTTGQYWPTEYRKAAAAVLASALWDAQRDELDQVPARVPDSRAEGEPTKYLCSTNGKWLHAGDWLRTSFRHWFGRGIQQRWFN